jgi:hypothetical protein
MVESQETSRRPRQYRTRPRQVSWPQSHRLAKKEDSKGVGSAASRRRAVSNSFELKFQQATQRPRSEPIPGGSCRNQFRRVADTVSMTSFPRLQSRSCTNDWLTPLGLSDELEDDEPAQTTADLYNRGIDAHSGGFIYNPLPVLEEDSRVTSSLPEHSPLVHEDDSSFQAYDDQWSCQADDGNDEYRRRLGRSIGSASHRRIGARAPNTSHQSVNTSLFDRLRRYSFMPLSEQPPECIRRGQPTQSTWVDVPLEEDRERKLSSRELLQEILDRSDPSSMNTSRSKSSSGKPNAARSRESSKQRNVAGRVPCSEDTTPHLCTDEQLTPLTDQSSYLDEGQTC